MSDERANLLAAALDYAARGWYVLPLHTPTGAGCSCGNPECSSVGKHPRTKNGKDDATTDPAMIRAWWQRWPDANVGIRTGNASGFFVLDIDSRKAVDALKESGRPVPKGARCHATGRGWQVLFSLPADFTPKCTNGTIAEHVDVKAEGGHIVAPPSLHANGKRYQLLTDCEPGPAPTWLLEALRPVEREQPKPAATERRHVTAARAGLEPYLQAALEDEAGRVRTATTGTRNDTLNRAAFSLGRLEAAGLAEADAREALTAAALAAGLTATETARTFAEGWGAGRQQPRGIPEPAARAGEYVDTFGGGRDAANADAHASGKRSTADRLVELGRQRYSFGQSDEGEPFGVATDGPRIARLLRGQGGSLRSELAAAYLDSYGKTPTQSALTDAVSTLEGLALRQPRQPLHVRFASVDGALWVDLGDQTGRVVRVTAEGWKLGDVPSVLFRRSALTGVLPEPVPGDLNRWRDFLNVTDEAWALLVGCLVSTFHDIPHPILALTGEQGSAKSTTARQYVDLCDPSTAPLRTAPRDIGEWVTVAAGSAVVGLDNVSIIPAWLSDSLCRAVTGDAFPRRALYTDGDIVVTAFRRCIVLNGIELGALSADLVDRAAFVELQRIPADRRRLDSDLQKDFAAIRPALFGGVLDLVAATLRHLPSIRLREHPRMADHAKVLAALDRVADLGALPAYLAVAGRAFQENVEGDAVASAVQRFMAGGKTWSGELADLLDLLTDQLPKPDRPPKLWPMDAARLSGRLRRSAPSLRAVGVVVDLGQDVETRHRTATITREGTGKTACLPRTVCNEQGEQAKQAEMPALSCHMPHGGDDGAGALLSSAKSQASMSGEPVALVVEL